MSIFDRFKRKHADFGPVYLYTEEELDQYEAYITEQFGEFTSVMHEIVSPDIHLDIIMVPPTLRNNYYALITMGMGAYKMKVPGELSQYQPERAELVLYLPPTWDLHSEKEEDYWPIRQLKIAARLPISCDTWLGYGHTISSDEENTPYASNTDFCSMMLVNARNKNGSGLELTLGDKGRIQFYQLLPLYREELEYKQRTDADALLDRLRGDGALPVVQIGRKNYGAG
ncbi:MAG: suppressor of fused domain protein [Blautia sp.]|nr:suppressor of fused domain protein [Blautia sp.]